MVDHFLIKRRLLSGKAVTFDIYDSNSKRCIFVAEMEPMRLKEKFNVYDGARTKKILRIEAREIIDVWAPYDVIDAVTNTVVGTVKGYRIQPAFSDARHSWSLLNEKGVEVGTVFERSNAIAWLRELLALVRLPQLASQSFDVRVGDQNVGFIKESVNPLRISLACDFSSDQKPSLDERMRLAIGILLCGIHGVTMRS